MCAVELRIVLKNCRKLRENIINVGLNRDGFCRAGSNHGMPHSNVLSCHLLILHSKLTVQYALVSIVTIGEMNLKIFMRFKLLEKYLQIIRSYCHAQERKVFRSTQYHRRRRALMWAQVIDNSFIYKLSHNEKVNNGVKMRRRIPA